MRFNEQFLDEIKSRLRLSDLVGRSVKLRRQGREFAGLSPFTKEKTPSFFVNDDKGFYHCFSSGKHGDHYSFLQETERLSFPEAVERLAAEAGVTLPAADPKAIEHEKHRQGLSDWLDLAAKWFQAELRRSAGADARAYLERRGLPESEWSRFGIGYAPNNRTGLKDYLIAKGARPSELLEAGLLVGPEDGGAPYDRFRGRIMFPIADHRGRLVSFGGRALDPEARAKYLNGPDTAIFDKGRTLYGVVEARKILAVARPEDPASLVVVEGYMDAIACLRAGIAAVAPMGTALTESQLELLWRFHNEPTLCFDGDAAGQRAADRTLDRALPLLKPGRSLRFAAVAGGKDPDEVLREQGPGPLRAQLSKTESFVDRLFDRERRSSGELATPEQKTALKVRLRLLASSIADADLSKAYRDDLLEKFDRIWRPSDYRSSLSQSARNLARERWGKRRPPQLEGASLEAKAAAQILRSLPRPLAAAVALAAINRPNIISDIEVIGTRGFGDDQLEGVAEVLSDLIIDDDIPSTSLIEYRLEARGFNVAIIDKIKVAAARSKVDFDSLSDADARDLWLRAFNALLNLSALERAVQGAKQDITRYQDFESLVALKMKRDTTHALVSNGEWMETDVGRVAA
jgi:DNA primase